MEGEREVLARHLGVGVILGRRGEVLEQEDLASLFKIDGTVLERLSYWTRSYLPF